MAELFRQFAFVNAVMGGFAITFLSVLLTSASRRRIVSWTAAVTVGAACCFIVSTLGATFSAAMAASVEGGTLPEEVAALRVPVSLLFLTGIALLFTALGLSGWVRSRRLGIATAVAAVLSVGGAFLMLRPFIY